ncbi:MAG: helicase-associated domain-containing protein, partial [Chloroflexota bacterium]
ALAETLSQLDLGREILYLGPEEADALGDLIAAGGRLPVASFERQHGPVRTMGPARIEREEPWLDPVSPAEGLWYRGFLYRAFDESEGSETVEYYYLPNELYSNAAGISSTGAASEPQPADGLQPVSPPEQFSPTDTAAVDDLTAILSAAQEGAIHEGELARLQPYFLSPNLDRTSLLFTLAWEMKLLRVTDEGARPARQVLTWLRRSRDEQARDIANAWSNSAWNELLHTPGLSFEGGWQNDPILARTALLDVLSRTGDWFRLSDLVARVRDSTPDFQRPDGNYDTWYIRDADSGGYLSGFESWDLVEGRLLRFLLIGPLAWLGLTETAMAGSGQETLFRLTPLALDWLAGEPPAESEVTMPIVVREDGAILVPFNASRYERFQVARVAEAEPLLPGKPAGYRLTPRSLERAREQGIGADRLGEFLARASQRPAPAGVLRAIQRWSERGSEATLEDVVLLRVRDAEVLEKLRANPKTRAYFSESMGDHAALVRAGDWPKLRQAAAAMGLFIDVLPSSSQDSGRE